MTTGRELEVNLSTLLGMNNRRPDFRLRTKDGVFVRAAVNALITDAGTAKRRRGYEEIFAGTRCHSFWADTTADVGFYADGANLYRVTGNGAGLARELMVNDLVPGRPLTYARVGTDIVFSDGVTNRCIGASGERPFGVPTPSAAPVVATAPGGTIPAGTYQVCIAYANDDLEIGGTTPASIIDVSANGKLTLAQLPLSWPAGVTMLLVYVSQANSSTMLVEQRLLAPVASTELTVLTGSGMQATTYLMRELPAGSILRYFASRLYSVVGNAVWYSDIYSPALCSPARTYVQFNAPVTLLEPCEDGMYLVADETYWIGGDIEAATARVVLPCTAVAGSACRLPQAKQVMWMTNKGMARGAASGQATLIQDENVAVAPASSGASFVLEADGQRHVVASLNGADISGASATSYMDAEVIRKGTTL